MFKVIAPAWITLGFYRGIKLYNYKYQKGKYGCKTYFYSECFCSGSFGVFIYLNPFLLPITFVKELHRLEINIRGLNEEKEKELFYELL